MGKALRVENKHGFGSRSRKREREGERHEIRSGKTAVSGY
jgi:hypothetical protein